MSKILAVKSSLLDFVKPDRLHMYGPILGRVVDIISRSGEYLERDEIENDPTYRQPIPYVMVRKETAPEFVVLERGAGQTEKRLHGKFSVAAGGHIEDGHSLTYTALKEVTEELGIPIATLEIMGTLVSSPANREPGQCCVEDVHIGIFYLATTHYRIFHSPEIKDQNPQWRTLSMIARAYPRMEKWSQIIIRDYLNLPIVEEAVA